MKVLFQLNLTDPEPLQCLNFEVDGGTRGLTDEIAAEMMIRMAHALEYISQGIYDEDSHVVHEVTNSTVVVFSPAVGQYYAANSECPSDDIHFKLIAGEGCYAPEGVFVWYTYGGDERFDTWVIE